MPLRLEMVLQSGTKFFNFVQRTHLYSCGTLLHNEFKFICVSGTLSLEVTNTPGTAEVRGLNLTRTCFFFQVLNKIVGLIFFHSFANSI